jgi:DNA-binding NtrC family response regulator
VRNLSIHVHSSKKNLRDRRVDRRQARVTLRTRIAKEPGNRDHTGPIAPPAHNAATRLHHVLSTVSDTIVADRFLSTRDDVRDLATGAPVWLRVEDAGDADAQRAWSDRAAALLSLRHRWLAPCVDFGCIGSRQRFEAFELPDPSSAADETPCAQRARRAVSLFLGAAGVPSGRLSMVAGACGPSIVPGPMGTSDVSSTRREPDADAVAGVQLADTPLRSALAELLREEPPPGVSLVRIAIPIGGGGRTLLREAARLGRLAGWVPLGATTLERWRAEGIHPSPLRLVRGRHVLLLQDARAVSGGPTLAAAVLDAPTTGVPWRLVQIVEPGAARVVLRWQPISAGVLAALVISPADPSTTAARVRVAATRSGGLPAAFVAALEGRRRRCAWVRASRYGLVHEGRGSYDAPEAETAVPPRLVLHDAIDTADQALANAERLARRGRSAAGGRWLRRSAGRLARRGHDAAAAEVLLAAVRHAIRRGRPSEALRLLGQVQRTAERGALAHAAIMAGVWRGRALLDLLDLDQALAVLRTAVTAADLQGTTIGRRWAATGLVRALCWAGRAAEAAHVLDIGHAAQSDGQTSNPLLAVLEHGCAVRIALARGRADTATTHVAAAAALARDIPDHAVRLAALAARARLHAFLGDHDALLERLPDALALCREARLPLEAVKYRLATLEACVRGRARSRALQLADRLHRAEHAVPPLLAARIALARASAHGRTDTIVQERLASKGFSFQICSSQPSVPSAAQGSTMFDEAMEVMRVCQEREEPLAVLQEVAEILRRRLTASVTLIVSKAPGGVVVPSPPQHRGPLASARRALDHGVAIAPQDVDLGHEAAMPVRYGGLVLGAVACRWVAGASLDGDRIVRLLCAAAAGLSPIMRSVADEGERPAVPQVEADILGVSAGIAAVRRTIAQAADAPFPIMVYGESGVGKELVARAVHRAGPRRARPFCAVNCAALPDELLEAELFGHVRGAFTGAVADRRGLFEEADGGVLFLDEVGELSARGQAKLLRVLQEHEVRRLGDSQSRRIDVRIVAATNRLLEHEVEQGRFRRDLRYRLDVIRILVPPLRERPEDVPVLVAALWPRIAARMASRAGLSDASLAALARYDWPGNVRELQNVLAALAVSAPRRGAIGPSSLPAAIARAAVDTGGEVTLEQARRRFEERFVRAALARAGGHRGRAAASLGLTRQGLSKLLDRLGVDVPIPAHGAGEPAAHTP